MSGHAKRFKATDEDTSRTATDKVASCELNVEPADKGDAFNPAGNNSESAQTAIPDTMVPNAALITQSDGISPAKSALKLAIDGLTALGEHSDKVVTEKWAKRAAPILAKSLTFLAAYEAASEAERKAVRTTLKAKSGVRREPNVDNLPVIAVYIGVSCIGEKRTKAQRKEWCRFAVVVKVAAKALISPEDAAQWLEKKTLNGLLAEWRDMQKAANKAPRKPSVPKALKSYEHLAAALAKGSKFEELAKGELAKADAAVGKAMSAVTRAIDDPMHGSA